jgi:hypothetical protein
MKEMNAEANLAKKSTAAPLKEAIGNRKKK